MTDPPPSSGQQPDGAAPGGQPQYGQPQYGQPQYGQPQYGQPQYGQPQYGRPPYGYAYPPVDKPVGWFIVNWLFFWPTAIYSLVKHWTPMDQAAYAGDIGSAQLHANAIRRLGIWALCINLALVACYIIIVVAVLSTAPTG